jgi:hypothetical protein
MIMLNVIIMSVVILNVIMQNVVMLSVVMLGVMAQLVDYVEKLYRYKRTSLFCPAISDKEKTLYSIDLASAINSFHA